MRIVGGPVGWLGPDAMEACRELLAAGESALMVHRPGPTVAFSARDENDPLYPAAVAAAERAGYAPVKRLAGGKVVAYDEGCVVVDVVGPRAEGSIEIDQRFVDLGGRILKVLHGLGVPAQVGEVPGEYCPGPHSINVGGTAKVVGTAQRVTRRAWLFSAVVVVRRSPGLARALDDVQAALARPWVPSTLGALTDFAPVTEDEVAAGLVAGLG
ncbi:lipoyl protein ligase domain-containing protein [Nocardioides bigeumensis]|uniref:BPL/LPL catalytic domain-containing protein n=1 Tax=Nocardioides bigeumensis TaxID=433657 RepID=A0ABP5KC33_9ACTN